MPTEETIENELFVLSEKLDKQLLINKQKIPMGFNRSKLLKKSYNNNYLSNTFQTHIQPVVEDEARPQKFRKARKPYWYYQTPFGLQRDINENELRILGQSVWVHRCKSIIINEVLSAKYELIPSDDTDYSSSTSTLINIINTYFNAINGEGQNIKEILKPFMNDVLDIGFGVMVKGYHKNAYKPINKQQGYQPQETGLPKGNNWTYVPSKTPEGLLRSINTHDAASFFKQPNEYGATVGWWQYLSNGIPEFFGNREIIHMMAFETSFNAYGVSPLETIKGMVNVLIKSVENTDDYLEKGAIPPGFLALSEISEDEFELFENRWKATVEGNPTEIPLISSYSGKIEFTPLVINTADIKQLDTIDIYQRIVMSVFHVTPAELGITDAVNKASAEQQSNVQQRAAVFPFLDKLELLINRFILKEFDPYGKIKFKWIKPQTISEKTQEWSLINQKLAAGILTINQYLTSIGKPIVAWGNVPFSMPLWTSMAQQIDPVLFGFKESHEDQNKAKLDYAQRQIVYLLEQMQYTMNNNREASPNMISMLTRLRMLKEGLNMPGALSLPPSSVIETENMIDNASTNNKFNTTAAIFNNFMPENKQQKITEKGIGAVIDFFQQNRDSLITSNKNNDLKYQNKYRNLFSANEKGFVNGLTFVLKNWLGRILGTFVKLPKTAMNTYAIGELLKYVTNANKKNMNRNEFKEVLRESMTDAYRTGSSIDNSANIIINNIDFEKADPLAMDWFDSRTLILADQFINKYNDKINHKVQDGFNRGLSIPQVVDSMKEIIPFEKMDGETNTKFKKRKKILKSQLTRIARTEINMAANRGRLQQLKNIGAFKWKHQTFFDDRNKDETPTLIAGKKITCRGQHGKMYNINDMRFLPSIHPNCRCTIHGVWSDTKKTSFDKIISKGISVIKKHPSAMESTDIVRELGRLGNSPESMTRKILLKAELEKRKKGGKDVNKKQGKLSKLKINIKEKMINKGKKMLVDRLSGFTLEQISQATSTDINLKGSKIIIDNEHFDIHELNDKGSKAYITIAKSPNGYMLLDIIDKFSNRLDHEIIGKGKDFIATIQPHKIKPMSGKKAVIFDKLMLKLGGNKLEKEIQKYVPDFTVDKYKNNMFVRTKNNKTKISYNGITNIISDVKLSDNAKQKFEKQINQVNAIKDNNKKLKQQIIKKTKDIQTIMDKQHPDAGNKLSLLTSELRDKPFNGQIEYLQSRLKDALSVNTELMNYIIPNVEYKKKMMATTSVPELITTNINMSVGKITKIKAKYVKLDSVVGRKCYNCKNYEIGNLCRIVEGNILFEGHCKFWK